MNDVTVVGAGIAGLSAAITAAQHGARVRVLEERSQLGGRARSSDPPYIANVGPHALYTNGECWRWLESEQLLPETVPRGPGVLVYRSAGKTTTELPGLSEAVTEILRAVPPVNRSFRAWAGELIGASRAELLSSLAFITTLDADAGRLSAAFVHERLRRPLQPNVVRYVTGGWSALVSRLAERASSLAVTIETRQKIVELPASPVIVATSAPAASRLLRRQDLRVSGTRVALRDLALQRRGDLPRSLLDIDERLYLARYTAFDESLAPPQEDLIQIACGCQPDEGFQVAQARIDAILDSVCPGWQDRLRWSQRTLLQGATGAIDLPGEHWADRPAIEQDGGLFLAGDYVAAPGLLGEVSLVSGARAGKAAAEWSAVRTAAGHTGRASREFTQ